MNSACLLFVVLVDIESKSVCLFLSLFQSRLCCVCVCIVCLCIRYVAGHDVCFGLS